MKFLNKFKHATFNIDDCFITFIFLLVVFILVNLFLVLTAIVYDLQTAIAYLIGILVLSMLCGTSFSKPKYKDKDNS